MSTNKEMKISFMENFVVAIEAEALSKTKISDNIYNLMVVITNQLSCKTWEF